MPKRKITWTKRATHQFNAAIEYIRKDSEQNADKVKEKILDKISELADKKLFIAKTLAKRIMTATIYILKF